MKKTITLVILLCCLFGQYAQAEPITLAQAKNIAAAYLRTGTEPRCVNRRGVAVRNTSVQPLYIFSRGAGEGFVMVSGDDALPAVLGYTNTGDYDEDNLPPALSDMIAYYTAQAESMQEQKVAKRAPRKASGTKDIAPLMTSHWHQSWPYNNLCPYLTGTTNRAATGCVATAASQIVYYWRKDLNDRTKYNTPTYGYGDAPVTETDMIPSGTPLKWDLMQDSYGGSDPAECTTAAATLVACMGMSAWLTYGSSTSGQIDNCRGVFSGQFGLNGGSTVWKDSYSQTTWEKMIVQDLEAGRPILYSGVHPSNGGHAVVIDGYQVSTNLFHFNFGWGSGNGYDGYYTVDGTTGMNGFYESQGMVWNIYPSKPNVSGKLSLQQGHFISRVANEITAKITNNGTLSTSGYYLYCLTGTNTPSASTTAQSTDTKTVIPSGSAANITFTFTPSSTSTYTLYLCDENRNILDKITDVETMASTANLTLNSMHADDGGETEDLTVDGKVVKVCKIYNTKKANITANFTNGTDATLCTPSVKGLYAKYDETTGTFGTASTKTKKSVTFECGGTNDIVFDLTSLTDNAIYRFSLEGTASTNKSFPINFATSDTVIYFRLVGADMAKTLSDDGTEAVVTGHYNPLVFATLTGDSTVSRYDLTQVVGVKSPLEAANRNALFYTLASQQVSGTNIITDGVCETLDLTPGYNFQPREDFQALSATYHATQAVARFGTAVLPFDAQTPTGMFARKVNMVKTSYLQEVDSCNHELYSGTPYIILTGEPTDVTAKNVKVSTHVPSLCTDTIRGTWTNIVATETNWVLDDADLQYFNSCAGQVIPALTAYLEYTKKVRSTSYPYNTKDKKAKQLAQQISEALATYQAYADVTTTSAQSKFLAVINEAKDTLTNQPLTAFQTEQIKALEQAAEAFVASAASTADNGLVDKSSYIQNPSFETGTMKSWNVQGGTATVQNVTNSLANYMAQADGSYVTKLPESVTLSQTLTGMENGVYQLVASVAAELGNHITLSAGEKSTTIESTDFGPMYLTDCMVDSIEVTDGTLTITVTGVEGWTKVDNFRLYQISGDSTPVQDVHTDVIAPTSGMYDLTGRRLLREPQRGIFIRNGRKVIKL